MSDKKFKSFSKARIPLVHWTDFESTDSDNPDIVRFKCIGTATESSHLPDGVTVEYVTVLYDTKGDGTNYVPRNLPLKYSNSTNSALKEQYVRAVGEGILKPGREFHIKTWKGIAKKSKHPFRDYELFVEYEEEDNGDASPSPS